MSEWITGSTSSRASGGGADSDGCASCVASASECSELDDDRGIVGLDCPSADEKPHTSAGSICRVSERTRSISVLKVRMILEISCLLCSTSQQVPRPFPFSFTPSEQAWASNSSVSSLTVDGGLGCLSIRVKTGARHDNGLEGESGICISPYSETGRGGGGGGSGGAGREESNTGADATDRKPRRRNSLCTGVSAASTVGDELWWWA